jgi:hypothetical protein
MIPVQARTGLVQLRPGSSERRTIPVAALRAPRALSAHPGPSSSRPGATSDCPGATSGRPGAGLALARRHFSQRVRSTSRLPGAPDGEDEGGDRGDGDWDDDREETAAIESQQRPVSGTPLVSRPHAPHPDCEASPRGRNPAYEAATAPIQHPTTRNHYAATPCQSLR